MRHLVAYYRSICDEAVCMYNIMANFVHQTAIVQFSSPVVNYS